MRKQYKIKEVPNLICIEESGHVVDFSRLVSGNVRIYTVENWAPVLIAEGEVFDSYKDEESGQWEIILKSLESAKESLVEEM